MVKHPCAKLAPQITSPSQNQDLEALEESSQAIEPKEEPLKVAPLMKFGLGIRHPPMASACFNPIQIQYFLMANGVRPRN